MTYSAEYKQQYIKDAVSDLRKVLKKFDDAYDDFAQWFENYNGSGSMFRGSDMEFKHCKEDGIDITAGQIYGVILEILKRDCYNDNYIPIAFSPRWSFDDEPINSFVIDDYEDEIISKLNSL